MKKISRKKLTTFNIFIRRYIESGYKQSRSNRYSAKQNLFWLCDNVKEIGNAVRPHGGKVSDDQVIALARYMIENPFPGFSMPQRMLDSLENAMVTPSHCNANVTNHRENPNPKIARRDRKRKRTSKVKEKEDFYKSWEWKRARYEVLKKHGPKCMLCHAERGDIGSDGDPVKICVDHIKPISKYWDLRLEQSNLQILCSECNMGKGAWDETDWRSDVENGLDDCDNDNEIPECIRDQLRYSI